VGYQYIDGVPTADPFKITISTWVYVSSKAVSAQQADAAKLDERWASRSVRSNFPLLEFGNSIEPRVGFHIGMNMTWEGYLGFFWWIGGLDAPSFPDYIVGYWIGGLGESTKGWFDFAGGVAYPSVDYTEGWKNVNDVLFGTAAIGVGTDFYYMPPGTDLPPISPTIKYEFFSDTGILPFNVFNAGTGTDFPAYPGGDHAGAFAKPTSWTWLGFMQAEVVSSPGRVAVLPGDIASRGLTVESEIVFNNFWSSPLNYTLQPTPTNGPASNHLIRVETQVPPFANGKYFAFGDLIILLDKQPDVTYGKPAIPSALYIGGDGSVSFSLTGRWPEKTTASDQSIVPTLTFTGGGFVLDSWNHIFFTADMTAMQVANGQDDPTLTEWVDTLAGVERVLVGVWPPELSTPPTWAMVVNGKKSSDDPQSALTVYPSADGHWDDVQNFAMQLKDGQVGFPIIPQELNHWKATGPNEKIRYAYTQVWFDKYIEATPANMEYFFRKSEIKAYNNVVPPFDKKGAQKQFGASNIWCYRDRDNDIKFQDNQGSLGGSFKVVGDEVNIGTAQKPDEKPQPIDFRPGPGQPLKKDQMIDGT
jgi:hypothetical protein